MPRQVCIYLLAAPVDAATPVCFGVTNGQKMGQKAVAGGESPGHSSAQPLVPQE